MGTNKRKLCNHIIAKMEWWRHAQWASYIDERTKDNVITVMQNLVDSIANNKQTYETKCEPEPPKEDDA